MQRKVKEAAMRKWKSKTRTMHLESGKRGREIAMTKRYTTLQV
jgi:hypothetical protein